MKIGLSILAVFFAALSSAQLQINEVCSNNETLIYDASGTTPDFVELLNSGSTSINLSDYYLSDKQDNLMFWQLPNEELASGELVVIWCTDEVSGTNYAPFRLNSSGEVLFLSTAEGDLDYAQIPALQSNHCYGRKPGSSNWHLFERGSPGEHNTYKGYLGYAEAPTFSVVPGFYSDAVNLELNSLSDDIFFTTSGSDPRLLGEVYSGPLAIDSTQVIKCVSIKPGYLWSEVVTGTFFIGVDKFLPVFSISCEPEDLWNEDFGIYVLGNDADTAWPFFGANYWDGRQIPVRVELYKNRKLVFNQGADMRIHGGKGARNMPQKPLRLIARSDYGDDYFEHQLIDHKPIHHFKKFVLRNSGGDFNQLHFRDGWINRHCHTEGLDIDLIGFEPAVVYLNGEYWGIQNIREKVDKYYCRTNGGFDDTVHFDILEEDTITIDGHREEFNDMVDFFTMNDMSDEVNYIWARNLLDIPSFTDYIIAETFWNNTDWPANNTKFWRPRVPGGKWRFVMFDMDVSLNSVGYVSEETDNLKRILEDYQHVHQIKLLAALLENEDFKFDFCNRYADLINTSFDSDYMLDKMMEFLLYIEPEMAIHRPRWGGSLTWWWFYHIEPRTLVFLEKRSDIARDQVQENLELTGQFELDLTIYPEHAGTIKLNTLTLNDSPWKGIYYTDVPISVNAIADVGYSFSHWQLPDGSRVEATQLKQAFGQNTSLIAVFEPVYPEPNFHVYPNPTKGPFEYYTLLDLPSSCVLEIIDRTGRIVYSHVLPTHGAGVMRGNADPELDSGLYLVVLDCGEERMVQRLIVE
jgi:hypothetical protein